MSIFRDDENETVRQTIERVFKEKGMWKDPKAMQTEIGDFTYYDDDDNDASTASSTGSLVGQPSSYFQNNNTSDWNNTGGFGSGVSNSGFSTNINMGTNANFGANQSFATTPNSIATSTAQNQTTAPWSYDEPSTTPTPWSTTSATPTPWDNGATYPQQMITPTPWSNPAEQISPVPRRNNQTITPWAGGYDLSAPTQSNDIQSIDYSRYGEGFSKEFIDKMLNDTEFQNILNEYIIPNEGGYNNDPADAGGETNMGIAQNAHTDEDIKNMTRERANAIYYRDYYNWNGLNKLPYPIRGFVVDYGLPTRPQLAVETVHKVLDIPPPSNIIGPTTLGKFENYTEEDYNNFLDKYREEMKKHFREVAQKNPQKRKFLNGWLNRADGAHLAR